MPELKTSEDSDPVPVIVKVCSLFRAISLPGSFFVAVLYWGLVFDGTVSAISVLTHGVTFVVMAFDTLLSRQTMKMAHWFYFELYTVVYVIWSIIFHVTEIDRPCNCSEDDDEQEKYGCDEQSKRHNGDECRYIYNSLNWVTAARSSTTILVLLLLLIATPICYLIFYWWVMTIRRMAVGGDKNGDNNGDNNVRGRQETIDHLEKNGCGTLCCYEMKCSRLSLTDENWVDNFRQSSFKSVSDSAYLYIRLFWFLFMFGVLLAGISTFSISLSFYLIFVTNWTLVSEVIYLFCALVCTYQAQKQYVSPAGGGGEDSL